MFNPKYCLFLEEGAFTDKSGACLGSQLIELIEFIDEKIPAHKWYVANVVAVGSSWDGFEKFKLEYIGETEVLLEKTHSTSQFESGVFIAIGLPHLTQKTDDVVDTEDKRFRKLFSKGVLIEIRAFDASFFMIFSEDAKVINTIKSRFGGIVEVKNLSPEE